MPNGPDDRAHHWDWKADRATNPAGLTTVATRPTYGAETVTLNYVGLSRSTARTIEAFVDAQKGRKGGFWCPSGQLDYYPSTDSGGWMLREYGQASALANSRFQHTLFYRASQGSSPWYINQIFPNTPPDMATDAAGYPTRAYSIDVFGGHAGNSLVVLHPLTFESGLRMMRMLWARFADEAITTSWDHPNLASIALTVAFLPAESPTAFVDFHGI
jgi:hypothetical protein